MCGYYLQENWMKFVATGYLTEIGGDVCVVSGVKENNKISFMQYPTKKIFFNEFVFIL